MEMSDFMEQARALQDKVAAAQDLLDKTIVRGIAGNGDVIVTMTGKYDLNDIQISDALLSMDKATVRDLLMGALNDAKAKADAAIDKVMGAATAGLEMPE